MATPANPITSADVIEILGAKIDAQSTRSNLGDTGRSPAAIRTSRREPVPEIGRF